MKFIKNHILLLTVLSATGWSPLLLAGELYPFTYVDHGPTISISACDVMATGSISIPAAIDGKPVTAINKGAFYSRINITGITLPSSVTMIGSDAFHSTGLTEILIPPSVISIEDRAFASSNLSRITISSSTTNFGVSVFSFCRNLIKVSFPVDTTYIASGMFSGCTALKSIAIPPQVTHIDRGAFSNSGLRRVILNSKLTRIDVGAFRECFNLTTVTFPESVATLGNDAFSSCTQLASVEFLGDAPRLGRGVFGNCGLGFKVFFTRGSARFTMPFWYGYPTSRPAPDIAVQRNRASYLIDGQHDVKFGNVILGKRTLPQTLTIRNAGTRKLKNLAISAVGRNSPEFIIKVPVKVSLEPGDAIELEVRFKPAGRGKREATLVIQSNDTDESPFEIDLVGKGLALIE